MSLPQLTIADVAQAVPEVGGIKPPMSGGQKVVFPCSFNGQQIALKFLLTSLSGPPSPGAPLDEGLARAQREISIMQSCVSPHLVKLGPITLRHLVINGQNLVCFSEEWIEGSDLKGWLAANSASIDDIRRLGLDVCHAIEELWSRQKVHRDIKPGNIMRRLSGEHVLLDLGLALDLNDVSLSATGAVPGTVIYLSPEQVDFTKKRSLDFRSDLFALGVVLFEALTRRHPFHSPGMVQNEVLHAILNGARVAPGSLRAGVPAGLDALVRRLLAKQPHLRYRSVGDAIKALESF